MSLSSGNVCSFKNCSNNSRNCKDLVPPIQFFTYPVRDKDRCLEWILKSGRDDFLALEDNKLKNRRVCSTHFEPNQITHYKKLVLGAVPRVHDLDEVAAPIVCVEPPQIIPHEQAVEGVGSDQTTPEVGEGSLSLSSTDVIGYESEVDDLPLMPEESDSDRSIQSDQLTDDDGSGILPDDSDGARSDTDDSDAPPLDEEITPRKQKMIARIESLSTSCHRKRSTINNLKNRASDIGVLLAVNVLSQNAESESAKVFLMMQARSRNSKAAWTKEQQNLALSFYYKSPSLYMFMKSDIKLKLPSYSTLIRWINVVNLRTGFCDEVFEKLEVKIRTMTPNEKECVLMFDEMAIKKWLEYDSRLDLVDGFEDLGPLGRRPFVATQALVFMVRGLKFNWKQHVAYFLAFNGVKFSDLAILIDTCIEKLFEIGLRVRVTVCDQGSPNRAAYELLGVTVEKPFFFFREHKIIAIFDVPHLLKSVRNNLMNHNFLVENKVVSWKDIVRFYDIDAEKGTTGSRSCPKLTAKHLFPGSFAKMSVKLAAQVFSHSVKAGMATAYWTGELKTPSCEATINFISKMNDLFDCLNSRHPYDSTPHRRPLANNAPALTFLKNSVNWLKTWKLTTKCSIPPCFLGLRASVNGILELWEDLASEGTEFLLTVRVTQDPLENSFAILRIKSGFNTNPSARQFRRNLQQTILINLLKPSKSSNCEPDEDVWLTASVMEQLESAEMEAKRSTDVTPEPPSASTPEPPSASTPEPPSASTPEPPSASTPEPPSASTPEPPSASTPEPPSASTPEPPSASTPEPPSASTPEPLSASIPEPPSASTPEPPSASTPEPLSASIPEPPSATMSGPSWASTPGPSWTPTPEPSWSTMPGPSWVSTPGPSWTPTHEPSWASTPGPSWASTPGPSWASTPGPSWSTTPGPSWPSTPGPSWTPTPEPSWASTPGPSRASTPGPSWASTPGPSWTPTPEPSWSTTPGPSWPSTPGPSWTPTPEPSWASTPGPSWASTPELDLNCLEVPTSEKGRPLLQHPSTDSCSIAYIAGWLARKCTRKFSCAQCKLTLVKSGQYLESGHEGLIYFRAFMTKDGSDLGNLTAPTATFMQIIREESQLFSDVYDGYRHQYNIREHMTQLMINRHPQWFEGPCALHRRFILNTFLKTKMFYDAIWLSRDVRDCPTKTSVVNITRKRVKSPSRKEPAQKKRGTQPKMNQKLKKLKHL